ncbi:MAG: hypothetical protein JRI39_08830 [Deltaproteobacteria bacterium]|nr:hypothetical protein [Deltaproteobacteria bacterium]MBW2083177.1 hypothetical protein [Deltaproteobacteria bacterium]HDM09003.1 hypothetical protein [Desulfobacteraceae bacterium]
MNRIIFRNFGIWVLWVLGFVIASCASVYEVQILYKLPGPSGLLQGKSLKFTVIDERQIKEFLKAGAKRELKHFSNNVSFAVAKYNEAGFKIGPLAPMAALKKAFERRIENEGINLAKGVGPGIPELEIGVKDFSLDFAERRWVASISYEARLKVDGQVRATQFISGSAERFKVLRKKGADMAVGDIFTDTLNRLDLVRLFQDARLM